MYILRMHCKLNKKLLSSNNYIKYKTAASYGFIHTYKHHTYVRRLIVLML